jgi:hypothetical protein
LPDPQRISPKLFRHSNDFPSPPHPPLSPGRCEKIKPMMHTASLVVQGTAKICRPKSAGCSYLQWVPLSSAKERWQIRGNPGNYNMISICRCKSSVPRGQRRNLCLFWPGNFCRPLDMVPPANFHSPGFFHSFPGKGEWVLGCGWRLCDLTTSPCPPCTLRAWPQRGFVGRLRRQYTG